MSPVARLRGLSMVVVLAFLGVTHLLVGDPAARAELQYRVVITLGWGHLLAALGRRRRPGPVAWRSYALGLCASSWLFALYAALLGRWPGLVLAALAISTWHTMENDLALARARRGLTLGPLPRRPREHLLPLGTTALVGSLVLGTAQGSALVALGGGLAGVWWITTRGVAALAGLALLLGARGACGAPTLLIVGSLLPSAWWSGWLQFADLFVVVTLHHLLSWLFLALARAFAPDGPGAAQARGLLGRLLLTHVPPTLLCGMLIALPAPTLDPVRTLVLAPGVYLFWSVLHVVQTACCRGLQAAPDHRARTEPRSD